MARQAIIRWNTRMDELTEVIRPHVTLPPDQRGPKRIGKSKIIAYALDHWAQQLDRPLDTERLDAYVRSYAEMLVRTKGSKDVENIYITDEMQAQMDAISRVLTRLVPTLADNRMALVTLALEKCADELKVTQS